MASDCKRWLKVVVVSIASYSHGAEMIVWILAEKEKIQKILESA